METQITLPRDAEGREIPLDTMCMYDCNGDSISITRWCFTTRLEPMFSEKNIWMAIDKEGLVKDPALLHLTPPDSWEKLLEDLDRCIKGSTLCMYYSPATGGCYDCTAFNDNPEGCDARALRDIKERIRKLRGEDE